jgi:cellulose synthase/poly-beta-1,6-N-acetylglucosamine synthase-like glycosyltransferase
VHPPAPSALNAQGSQMPIAKTQNVPTVSTPSSARRAMAEYRTRLRGLMLVAVLGLLTLLVVKFEYKQHHSNYVFYGYGIAVTAVVLMVMSTSLALYRDPAVTARLRLAQTGRRDDVDLHPLVSCVVAVHNEEDVIGQCIASMAAQTYQNTEIIVIDDASTDSTLTVLRTLATEYSIRLVELPANRGKKAALAAGLLQTRGSIIAFADSDTVWAPHALEMAVPIFVADPDVGAVSGHCRALNSNASFLAKVQDTWYEGQFSVRKAFESVFGAVTCVSGPLAFFRLSAIYNFMPAWEADRFLGQEFRFATDRTLTAYVLGGRYLGPKAMELGRSSPFATPRYPARDWKIVYSKSTRAWTKVPTTLKAVLKQQVRWKKSFIRNIFVTGRFYWRRPFLPALWYYLHVLFVLFGPFVAARHLIYLPLRGNIMSAVLYLVGILFIGVCFALAFRYENPGSSRWLYRPAMSIMSTLLFSWLIFYSAATIKKMTWYRG